MSRINVVFSGVGHGKKFFNFEAREILSGHKLYTFEHVCYELPLFGLDIGMGD